MERIGERQRPEFRAHQREREMALAEALSFAQAAIIRACRLIEEAVRSERQHPAPNPSRGGRPASR